MYSLFILYLYIHPFILIYIFFKLVHNNYVNKKYFLCIYITVYIYIFISKKTNSVYIRFALFIHLYIYITTYIYIFQKKMNSVYIYLFI